MYPLHNIAPPSGVLKKSNRRISSISLFPSFSSSYARFITHFPPLQRNRGFLLTVLKPLCKLTHISSRERNPQWPNKPHSFPSFYRAYPEYFCFLCKRMHVWVAACKIALQWRASRLYKLSFRRNTKLSEKPGAFIPMDPVLLFHLVEELLFVVYLSLRPSLPCSSFCFCLKRVMAVSCRVYSNWISGTFSRSAQLFLRLPPPLRL